MRPSSAVFALTAALVVPQANRALAQPATDTALVRRQLEKRYDENRRAFFAKDLDAIMALRTEDFHALTPDGLTHDRAEMRLMTQALLNGIDKWVSTTFDIDSLTLEGHLARAIVRQHADRIALRGDGQLHHVETWVTQRETWRKTPDGWKLYRVEGLRDQRRLIDGKPGS